MSNIEISQAERLDQTVIYQFPELSRSSAVKLIEDGKVLVNGEVATKPGYKIRVSDKIVINYRPADQPQAPDIALPVLYEDADCVVIVKPLGLLTHSKGAFNPEASVATWLRQRSIPMSGERAGIVHRLDRATSGVMICAKTPEALSWLQKQFAQRRVKKTYIALVKGELKHPAATIDMPIERNPKKPQTFRVGVNGKSASTDYKVLKTGNGYSLIELKPLTGRTHQLRVHLAQLGHPIVGDSLYNGAPADRLYLHALQLEVTLPNRSREVFTTELPAEFEAKLSNG